MMRQLTFRRCVVPILVLGTLIVSASLIGLPPQVRSDESGLPDLVPMGLSAFAITTRLGGVTLEFSILTANIGDLDFKRPRDPQNPSQWLLRDIYEYTLYNERDGAWVEVDRRRANTICLQDDTQRGSVFPCLQRHGPVYNCGVKQGISRGWALDLFRGLTGQWVFIGTNTGRFLLEVALDPDRDLQRSDILPTSRDADPNNNFAYVTFTWDGASGTVDNITLCFAPEDICPTPNE